jgi:hypothetical protein
MPGLAVDECLHLSLARTMVAPFVAAFPLSRRPRHCCADCVLFEL